MFMDRKEVRDQWDRISEEYAKSRDPSGADADLIEDLLEEAPEDPDALDVGCGDGERTLANLPDGSVGIDVSRRGLGLAEGSDSFRARLLQADMVNLPFEESSFDCITAYHAVFHVPRQHHPEVYEEFARVLRPGGVVLMTLPGGRFETVRRGWMGGRMLFSSPGRGRTLELLRESGFDDVRTIKAPDPLGSNTEFALSSVEQG